ncbi:hypothetical protein OS12_04510 [Dickeya oryzae]
MVLRSPDDFKTLYETGEKIKAAAYASGLFLYVQNDLSFDSPQAHITIDNVRASEMGVTMQSIADTLAVLVGEKLCQPLQLSRSLLRCDPAGAR